MTLPEKFAFGGSEIDGFECPIVYMGYDDEVNPYKYVAMAYDDYICYQMDEPTGYEGTISAELAEKAWRGIVEEIKENLGEYSEEYEVAEEVCHELFD